MSKWLIPDISILRGSESQCILPIVRPKQISGAAMTPDSKTQAHTLTRIYTHAHKCAAGINEKAEPVVSVAVYPALFLE